MLKRLLLLSLCILAVSGRALLNDDGSAASASDVEDNHKPESPDYKVINKTGAFELRQYEEAAFVVAFGRSKFFSSFAAIKAGFSLARYFNGGNNEHEHIHKTIPLLAFILPPPPPPHGPKNGSHPEPPGKKHGKHHPPRPPPGPPAVALSAFTPKKYKGSPPDPDCPHVKVLHVDAFKVYAHKFSGWVFSWTLKKEIRHLADALKDEGICPRKGRFSLASYDGPWKFFNRQNELWWVEKTKHHNKTEVNIAAPTNYGDFDVETLFPEEFPREPETLAEGWPDSINPAAALGADWESPNQGDTKSAPQPLESAVSSAGLNLPTNLNAVKGPQGEGDSALGAAVADIKVS